MILAGLRIESYILRRLASTMSVLAGGMDYVDLNFLGRPGIIATAVLKGAGGVALVDPGPSTTLDALLTKRSLRRG